MQVVSEEAARTYPIWLSLVNDQRRNRVTRFVAVAGNLDRTRSCCLISLELRLNIKLRASLTMEACVSDDE